ncbi:MAG: DNA polymerase III subunit delta' [Nitrospinales bacterium]
MSFDHILGQKRPIDILRKSLENGTPAHAYLFYGRESVGKKQTAIALAKALNCTESPVADACGQCISCRKIENGIHPDFFLLEPVKSSASAREGAIRIDEIRNLQKKLNYLPHEGATKVAVIDSAEKMNVQAANAFLKTLEEPPRATLLILITPNFHQLLPTIISRCQAIAFQPLPPEAVKQILARHEEIDPAERAPRAARCRGQINRALEENLLLAGQNREELLELIETVSFDRVDVVFQWSRRWAKNNDRLPDVLDELMSLLRDLALLKSRCRPEHILNNDLMSRLKPLAVKKNRSSLLKMFESVLETRHALQGNMNVQLSMETMLLRFCDAV